MGSVTQLQAHALHVATLLQLAPAVIMASTLTGDPAGNLAADMPPVR